jgi:hypothetical protein
MLEYYQKFSNVAKSFVANIQVSKINKIVTEPKKLVPLKLPAKKITKLPQSKINTNQSSMNEKDR